LLAGTIAFQLRNRNGRQLKLAADWEFELAAAAASSSKSLASIFKLFAPTFVVGFYVYDFNSIKNCARHAKYTKGLRERGVGVGCRVSHLKYFYC